MSNFFSKINRKHILIIILLLSFVPFPSQMIPAWKIQIVDESNAPLSNVKVQQIYENYTFWGCCSAGYDDKVSNENGYAVFPPKYLWASGLFRIIYPPIAFLSKFAHGSAGAYSYVRTIDDNYSTVFSKSWSDKEMIYFHSPTDFPDKLVTKRISNKTNE